MYNWCKQVSVFFSSPHQISIDIGEANLSAVAKQTRVPNVAGTVGAVKQLLSSESKSAICQPFKPEEAAYQPPAPACRIL